jgi:phytoene synthase
MIRTELDAAGIDDPRLRNAYRSCRKIAAENGRTYFLATRLLAPDQRPAVHALYAFARLADDILDEFNPNLDAAARADRLQHFSDQFFSGAAPFDEPVLAAVHHTVARYGIGADLFEDFLASMRMDLTVTDYPDRAALNRYMRGSAEVIGLQMLPVLGGVSKTGEATDEATAEAAPYAAALGRAFQLTNFLRDVDEDLARNRVYLPADELAAHGVDRDLLMWCHDHRCTDMRVRDALAAQHEITRDIYRFAADGVALLAPRSRPCVTTALTLYSEILDCIELSDFSVFNHRATVGTTRRLQVAGSALFRSWRVRFAQPEHQRRAAA